MNPIEFLFKLIARFIDMEEGRITLLREQAAAWITKNRDHKVWGPVIKYGDEWYVQVLLCIVFVISVKAIGRWMVSSDNPQEDDEDTDEDAEFQEFLRTKRAASSAPTKW